MSRSLTAAVLAELAAAHSAPVYLLEAEFGSGTARACTWDRDITWNGNTYLGNGNFLGVEDLSESTDLEVSRVRVTLSGVDQSWIASVLAEDYIGRALRIWQAFLDDSYALIADPFKVFDGVMDDPSIEDQPAGDSVVSIIATNAWADWQHPRGRRTSDSEQQLLFPGDLGLEFADQGNRTVTWGRHVVRPAATSSAPPIERPAGGGRSSDDDTP